MNGSNSVTLAAPGADGGSIPDDRPPGWALTGGRKKNVAIAAATTIDEETGGRGQRFSEQTPEEAARLAEYNRYLAELNAADAAGSAAGSVPSTESAAPNR